MKRHLLLLLTAFCLFPLSAVAQERIPFRVLFWNVENLFDCHHDTLKNDNEFLPDATRRWHNGRYKKKLADLSQVIAAVSQRECPALIGLCEVENDQTLQDLTKRSPLKEFAYRYVMTDSPDDRGIDVALLYQRDKFKLLNAQSIPVTLGKGKNTRDILHVSGLVATKDTLDVFVVHFPSRAGGERETELNRILAAQTLRAKVDSLCNVRLSPYIIIMGDFNDYPKNRSIAKVLNAQAPKEPVERTRLYHLLAEKARKRDYGSYKYQGNWGLLDHLIVSGSLLLPDSRIRTSTAKADVVCLPFMLEEDVKYGGKKPFRTYNGMRYQGGVSDHLPVFVDLGVGD